MFDVSEIAQNRLGRFCTTVDPEMPLQITNPQHQLGDRSGARVRLDTDQLVRVDRKSGTPKRRHFAEASEQIEHLAFEPLQVLQRDIEEIAGTAGGIEDGDPAEVSVKSAQLRNRTRFVTGICQLDRGSLDRFPIGAQRLDDGRQHQTFDIGSRGVMRAEPGALVLVERAFQQGSEDRRLYGRPIRFGGIDQKIQLIRIKRDRLSIFKQTAVEAQDVITQLGGKPALVHVGPQAPHHRCEGLRFPSQPLQQFAKAILRQQADIFGEHRELRPSKAKRAAISRVTLAAWRLGSRDSGSSQIFFSRSRISSRVSSGRTMRKLFVSGNAHNASPCP